LLAPPVRGIDLRVSEEREQGSAFVVQVGDELAALVVGLGRLGEQLDPFGQVPGHPGTLGVVEVSGGERFVQHVTCDPWRAPRPAGQIFDQLVAAAAQVR
jgi:hypothetical protein